MQAGRVRVWQVQLFVYAVCGLRSALAGVLLVGFNSAGGDLRARHRRRVSGVAKLGRGNVALAERPEPAAGAGQVVLAVEAAGICGTDIHIVDDEFRSRPPVTMGHEV